MLRTERVGRELRITADGRFTDALARPLGRLGQVSAARAWAGTFHNSSSTRTEAA